MPISSIFPASFVQPPSRPDDTKLEGPDKDTVQHGPGEGSATGSAPDCITSFPMPRPGDICKSTAPARMPSSDGPAGPAADPTPPTGFTARTASLLGKPLHKRRIEDAAVSDAGARLLTDPMRPSHRTRLADTETVKAADRVLRKATDLTHYPWWSNELDEFFDIRVVGLEGSAYAKVDFALIGQAAAQGMRTLIADDMRTFLKDLYDRSETFRGLANHARAAGKIKKGRAWIIDKDWAIDIVLPDALKDGKAIFNREMGVVFHDMPILNPDTFPTLRYLSDKNRIVIPDIKSPPYTVFDRPDAVYEGGTRRATSSPLAVVHEMVHALTGERDPVRPSIDRGAVEYLAQRVLKEAGIKEPRQLTYIIPTAELPGQTLAGFEHYIVAQDDYLMKLFPISAPTCEDWDPSRGNERWISADTTQDLLAHGQPPL